MSFEISITLIAIEITIDIDIVIDIVIDIAIAIDIPIAIDIAIVIDIAIDTKPRHPERSRGNTLQIKSNQDPIIARNEAIF